jgi:hypothetical protein
MGSAVSSRRTQRSDGASRNSDTPSAQKKTSGNNDSKKDDKRTHVPEQKAQQEANVPEQKAQEEANVPEQKAQQEVNSPGIDVERESSKPLDQSNVPADQKGYFYVERTPDGKKKKAGPFKLDEMKQFFQDEKLDDFTMVWHKSFGTAWKHLADIPALKQQQLDEVSPDHSTPDSLLENHDEALLIASRDGDLEAITHLVRRYKEKVQVYMVWCEVLPCVMLLGPCLT